MEHSVGSSYAARKALFAKGVREGRLRAKEIDEALPPGALTAAERWLFYYCLRAAEVDIVDVDEDAHGSEVFSRAQSPG